MMYVRTPKILLCTLAIVCLSLLLPIGIAFLMEQFKTLEDRISRLYSNCSYQSNLKVTKQQVYGERHISSGSEILKSDDNKMFILKAYNYDGLDLFSNPIVDRCLAEDGQDNHIYLPLLQGFTEYEHSYNVAVSNGDTPSEFRTVKINKELNGTIGLPIRANQYRYYVIYPSEISQIEAAYTVCSSTYSKYGNWNMDSSIGSLPTNDDVTVTDHQMRLADNGTTLVLNIDPRSLSSTSTNDGNLGRCIRGVLAIPEHIRKDFEDDWWSKYVNGSSNTKQDTMIYDWGNLEMKVRHSTDYNLTEDGNKYNSEITIYAK